MLDVGAAPSREDLLDALSLASEAERRRCEEDFAFFAKRAWHTIEPMTRYIHGPHIEAIVDHLDACLPRVSYDPILQPDGKWTHVKRVEAGHIRKLLINMPPRHMKSTLVSVLWPAYVWTTRPEFRWLFTSYSLALSIRDTLKMRAVVMSPWYQSLWAPKFRLLPDQNEKSKFFNTAFGYRISGSVESGVTGEGGDGVIVDDPHNVRDADSAKVRETTENWWFESMTTRLNNPDTGFHVAVFQRVHEKDIAEKCKERGYVHLNLPARFDSARRCSTMLGWTDWRMEDGELLWPDRFNQKTMLALEKDLGDYGTASQLQQDPKPRGGAFIKRDWFGRVDAAHLNTVGSVTWVRGVDMTLTKEGDLFSSVEMGIDKNDNIYLRRGLAYHEDLPEILHRIEAVGKHEKNIQVIECIGTTKSAGDQAAALLLGHCMVQKIESKENKISMAMEWIPLAQAGKIFFVEEGDSTADLAPSIRGSWPFYSYNKVPWIERFLEVLTSWKPDPTVDQVDDPIDAISLAFHGCKQFVSLDRILASGQADPSDEFDEDDFDDIEGRYT